LSIVKTDERRAARRLRRVDGRSVKEIADLLEVARSSVSLWVRDIELTEEQVQALQRRNSRFGAQNKGAAANAERGRERRRQYQECGRQLARRSDPLHVAGVMLYWGEGDKRDRHSVRIANADPDLLRCFLDFLRAYFCVSDSRVRIKCNLFADHSERQREIEQFWLDTLRLPRSCLQKSTMNVYSKYSQRKRQNKLPHGTCRLMVCDTRIIQSIYGSIQEYAGFERPEWLG
jgi:hypothetical protein